MQDAPKENNPSTSLRINKIVSLSNYCYQRYRELGGVINEKDYESALAMARNAITPNGMLIKQAELIAQTAEIELCNAKGAVDQRVILYGVLRTDTRPEKTQYHHSQMCDQRLFAEALRMLGDVDSLNKLVDAYHKVGTYCLICLKVIASGEECR